MAATRISEDSAQALAAALQSETVISRYLAKVVALTDSDCEIWSGAVSGKGHGRFWISGNGRDQKSISVIAHRFSWGMRFGIDALLQTPVLAHRCDNPLCQNPDHLLPTTNAANRAEWASRRHQLRNPLRDLRGARGRAREVRDAVKAGQFPELVEDFGVRQGDRDQMGLW